MKFFAYFLVIAVAFAQSISANPNLLGPDYQPLPTLRRYSAFNATNDAIALRGAMEGLGTAEEVIVSIMTHRNENQRNQIEQTYNAMFDRDLMQDFKDELTGCLEDIVVGLLEGPTMFLVNRLHKAIAEGWSTDKNALIDIIAPRTNQEIAQIETAYDEKYDTSLTEELGKDTSKHYRRLLMGMVKDSRRPRETMNAVQARLDAEVLNNAGANMETVDEVTFNTIMTRREPRHMREMFLEYKKKSGKSIDEAIKEQTSGAMKDTLLTIVESAQNRAVYFAKRLHKAMDGIGTDEAALRRILVSRAEKDLGNIKMQYERLYDRTLSSHIESEMSGYSQAAMMALVG